MGEITDNKVVRTNTGSGAINLVVISLAASLSGPALCYGFEEDSECNPSTYNQKPLNSSIVDSESLERIKSYTEDNYGQIASNPKNPEMLSADLKFAEISQSFADNQIDMDPVIQDALNQFSKTIGKKQPKKNRF